MLRAKRTGNKQPAAPGKVSLNLYNEVLLLVWEPCMLQLLEGMPSEHPQPYAEGAPCCS